MSKPIDTATEHIQSIARNIQVQPRQVATVLELFAEGSTIPFIARYRKDKTGGLDEVQIQQIQEQAKQLAELQERRTAIEKSITEQGKMTEQLLASLHAADTLAALEDIYLPYKPKRKTKAQVAREHGLEPLADLLLKQDQEDILEAAGTFLNEHILTAEDALQGARDIIAEMINEDAEVRATMRRLFETEALLQSKVVAGKETEGIKYKDYFDYSEPVSKVPSHRGLAILRGFLEGFLRIGIGPDEDTAIELLFDKYVKGNAVASQQVQKAAKDSYRRLLQPSLESEFRSALKQRSDEEAIQVFAENLRQLLLSAPLGNKRILAIDPGYRTGCKVVCLDEKGDLIGTSLIYIHEGNKAAEAGRTITDLVRQYQVEAIAIGDGTGGRETEMLVKRLELGLPVFLVNEDGASVYSASEIAREEFPDQDVTIRGSVSIGRRLMDPLAELVKIDPKSIGVGQYQHDVNQFRLKERLDQTVVSCVNAVGVNVNTASKHLLSYVSGIGPSLAENIVRFRSEAGKFSSRSELLKVPRLGDKAFEQAAGFLRIPNGDHPLDASAVHPEAYTLVERMAADLKVDVQALVSNEALIRTIDPSAYADEKFGLLTIRDILSELQKPGLDPRSEAKAFDFADIHKMEDVIPGAIVPGIVTNLTRFGAFVDIGVKQDGLVHVSEMAHRYVADPSEVLKLNQHVMVKVLEVDIPRKRISLSVKQAQELPRKAEKQAPRPRHHEPARPKEVSMGDALARLKDRFSR